MTQQKQVIGWQIVDHEGWNIHGDDEIDPFNLASYEILVDDAVETARAWAAQNPGFNVIEVFEGDIEKSRFVGQVKMPDAPRVP